MSLINVIDISKISNKFCEIFRTKVIVKMNENFHFRSHFRFFRSFSFTFLLAESNFREKFVNPKYDLFNTTNHK